MIINGQKIVEGTKEDYIYFLLKNIKFHLHRIFPLYEKDYIYNLINCNICKKYNNVVLKDGYDFTGEYFHCIFCNCYNENSIFNKFDKSNKPLYVFAHKYVLIDNLFKIKKNKIDKFYISPKKYKYKILWSKSIIKVNEEIKQTFANTQRYNF